MVQLKRKRWGRGWLAVCLLGVAGFACALKSKAQPIQVEATIDGATDNSDATKITGFSIKKEDQKVIEQFEDFERYRDKKAWEKAFKSLDGVLKAVQTNGMAPSKDGFWIPSRQKVLQSLVSMPPEGKEAYRLFYDAAAKQSWSQVEAKEAAGDSDTLALLRDIVRQYFITSVGDKAADHLGDALFEIGDYTGAAKAWDQILTSYPDTSLPPLRLQMKQATALARAGRIEQFKALAAKLSEKFPGESVKLAGRNVSVEEYLAALAKPPAPTTIPTTSPTTVPATNATASSETPVLSTSLNLPAKNQPAWQMMFMDEALSEKIFSQLNQNGWGMQMSHMARVVPSAATDGKRVYLNWYGIIWAVDAESGKLLWWTDHFKKLGEKFNELTQWQVDADRFTVTLAGNALLTVALSLDKLNNQEPFRLTSMDPATGKKNWSSATGPLAGWAFIGSPLVVEGTIYITAHPSQNQEIHLLALALGDGKLLWESTLGQPQVGNNWRGMPVYPLPVLKHLGSMLYVMTNNGAVIAFDTVSRSVEWAFSYERHVGQNENNRFGWNGQQMEPTEPPAAAVMRDGVLYFKDLGGREMYALDLGGPTLKWHRPVASEATIAGYDDRNFYLLSTGQDNTALDVVDWQSGKMTKSSKLPDGNESIRAIAAGASYFVFLSRGIFEINTAEADVTRDTRSFRGIDLDSMGGVLLRTGDKLISVSNLSVTAYPIGAETHAER